jgi:AAA15 family ATPase/GTPase
MLYIDSLHIKNYRVLKELRLTNLTPLSVFVGPNGSGKSTLLEALTFLSDCFQQGLGTACQKYGGISDLKSYGMTEQPIQFQMTYVDSQRQCRMLYSLVIQSKKNQPYVERETLTWADEESTAKEKDGLRLVRCRSTDIYHRAIDKMNLLTPQIPLPPIH